MNRRHPTNPKQLLDRTANMRAGFWVIVGVILIFLLAGCVTKVGEWDCYE